MTTTFKFIGVEDCGPMPNGACCPHCGAEGRYIYVWEEDGKRRGAMAGCYKQLTGKIQKGELDQYVQLISEKQAKGKKLNTWDESVIRLLEFKQSGKYPAEWCDKKINETLGQRNKWLAEHRY